jgi:hypothetical protein
MHDSDWRDQLVGGVRLMSHRGNVSPYAFIGTVISTEKDDRIATVITDGGRQVIVLGTPDTSWFSKSFSSADRRFAVGRAL